MYRNILVATDGSAHARKAVQHAGRLARESGAQVLLFHAAPHVHAPVYSVGLAGMSIEQIEELANNARDEEARKLLADARTDLQLPDAQVEELFVISPHPYAAILEAAKSRGCDLIVMAPHGHRGVAGVLLGSETHKVLTHAGVPVLVVK